MRIHLEPGKGMEIANWLLDADIILMTRTDNRGIQHYTAQLMHCLEEQMTAQEAVDWILAKEAARKAR